MKTNTITTQTFLNPFSNKTFYHIAVDGVCLEDIIIKNSEGLNKGLVPTLLNWLYEENEKSEVWKRVEMSDTMLPLLMCSDDIDLWCTLIMVEMHKDEDYVYWKRFGLEDSDATTVDEIGKSIKWFPQVPSMVFKRTSFERMVMDFKLGLEEKIGYPPAEKEKVITYTLF